MLRAILLTTLVGATALCVSTACAGDSCPSNVVCIAGLPCESTTTAVGGAEAHFLGGISVFASYNWTMNACGAFTQMPFDASIPIEGTVVANEDFIVTGLPPGTPLTIHARIRVVASAYTAGVVPTLNQASGWLEEASAGRVEATAIVAYPAPQVDIDEVRSLDIPNLTGEPFRLTMGASSLGWIGGSRVSVTLSFADLPPGAVVQSCQSTGAPVPTRPVSWGNLKSLYR